MDMPSSFSYTTTTKTKKSKSSKLSTDPQSVAARQRRHRISDRFKTLQSLVPGGTKMDTVTMLEEAIQYVKFLKTQIWLHQAMITLVDTVTHLPTAPPSNPAVLPFYCQDADAEPEAEAGVFESWFSGEENGGF